MKKGLRITKVSDGTVKLSGRIPSSLRADLGDKAAAGLNRLAKSGKPVNVGALKAILAGAGNKRLVNEILGFSQKGVGTKGQTMDVGLRQVKNPALGGKAMAMQQVEVQRRKYPRTWHLPWSETLGADDKRISADEVKKNFEGKRVIVSQKRDGENTTIYSDGSFHARSPQATKKPEAHQKYIAKVAEQVSRFLPNGFRLVGENLFAQHAIAYDDLKSYFEVFSVWDGDRCLSWDETKQIVDMLNEDMRNFYQTEAVQIHMVPEIYDGQFDEKALRELPSKMDLKKQEGYVLRLADEFQYDDFGTSVAKYVRKGHVAPDAKHWKSQTVVPNKLKNPLGGKKSDMSTDVMEEPGETVTHTAEEESMAHDTEVLVRKLVERGVPEADAKKQAQDRMERWAKSQRNPLVVKRQQ